MIHIYKRELHSFFISPLAYAICAVFMLIFSITFIYGITDLKGTTFSFSFPTIFYVNFFYFIFLLPALTMKSFTEERRAGTEVLLFSAPVKMGSVVMGKFLAVSTVYLLMLLMSFVYPLIAMIYGGVIWSSLICGYIGFFLWGMCCLSIGLLISSLTENQVVAAILSEGAMLLIFFLDAFKSNAFLSQIPVVSNVLNYLSSQDRFLGFSKGIFTLDDVIYYVIFIAAFLCITVISIEKRRFSR